MKLTKRAIDSFKYKGPEPRRDIRWDEVVPGLGLRVYPSGKKSFVLAYRIHGRKRLMTLQRYGVMTLDQARKKAKKILVDSVGESVDPLEARRRAAQGETMADLCDTYLERYAKPRKKSWKDDERRINQHLKRWRNNKVVAITRADIAALHSKVGAKAPYEANRLLALLSKMFELALEWGFLEEGAPNPAKRIKKFAEKKRDRWITPEELPRLAKAIDTEDNIYVRSALWLYLLTGARKTEILQAKWKDIDWERKELRMAETKAGRVHYLPLSGEALALLRELPRLKGNPYMLPGRCIGRPLVNIDKPWRRVRKTAGVEDVRLHDLRRTVGSWLAQAGNSLHLIGKVLNHSNQSTTAVYARFQQDTVRDALEQHGQRIMGAAKKKQTAEVVDIEKARS